MALEPTYEANTLSVIIEWVLPYDPDEEPMAKDVTGATIEAIAAPKRNLASRINLSTEIVSATAGQIRASAPAFAFDSGAHLFQMRVTVGGKTRTYEDELIVKRSLKQPA